MTRLAKVSLLRPLNKLSLSMCEPCSMGKASSKPFSKALKAFYPLELVHSNICGPMNIKAQHDAIYFFFFIDDYLHFGYVYPTISSIRSIR